MKYRYDWLAGQKTVTRLDQVAAAILQVRRLRPTGTGLGVRVSAQVIAALCRRRDKQSADREPYWLQAGAAP